MTTALVLALAMITLASTLTVAPPAQAARASNLPWIAGTWSTCVAVEQCGPAVNGRPTGCVRA